MNTNFLKEIVEGSLDSSLSFPEVVAKLLEEGFESYHVDLVRSENRYYMPNGVSYVEQVLFKHPKAAVMFSAAQVKDAVKTIQAGKIKYKQFLHQILEAGCVYYIAYLSGKQVIYFGRGGDFYIEKFPSI